VLHHNDPQGLRRTFAEIFRVLKPGGRLLMVNETLKTRRDPVGVHVEGVEQFEGYEHAHWAAQYRWEAIRAGFATQLIEPSYHWFFRERPAPRVGEALRRGWRERRSPAGAAKSAALQTARGTALGRRAYLAWVLHVAGGTQMSMIATKPLRLLGAPSASTPERVARSLGSATASSLRSAVRGLRRPAVRPG
jgi:SAM-dependent methyltransferase